LKKFQGFLVPLEQSTQAGTKLGGLAQKARLKETSILEAKRNMEKEVSLTFRPDQRGDKDKN